MERRYFTKMVDNTWGEEHEACFTTYIVTPAEWEGVKRLCGLWREDVGRRESRAAEIAGHILSSSVPYERKDEAEPDMPSGAWSFSLVGNEAEFFDSVVLGLGMLHCTILDASGVKTTSPAEAGL